MKINRVILPTTHYSPAEIDQLIEVVMSWGRTPIVALGKEGDLYISECTQIEHCDLAFDPNEISEFSHIQAGLEGCRGHTLILKSSVRTISLAELTEIETAFYRAERDESIIRRNAAVLEMHFGPRHEGKSAFVISREGLARVRDLPLDCAWPHDPRLSVSAVSCAIFGSAHTEFVGSSITC